ncbi:hypothetical protein CQ047_12140 [Microbacterium sp. MYb72]|uniref:hypothetical protein n=1 Tax=Microbacterium sp. MYb72 TaxID=1848693 RepID=UPI000CFAA63D|nr:hypothetical protein [Microbacterium sp. MYb72]PRB08623.1 hypothetical protein CQ047_12140 [Microbacterium sp. MYb72]
MVLTRSFPTQHPSGLPITDTRRVAAALVARNADGTPRAGVFPANANPLVTGRASMGYDVAPFLAATSRINNGVELIANDAVTVVATTAAPASNSRIDVIWVRSQFVQHADANNDVVFGVTQGTPAGIPAKPAIPQGALELATAEITSTTTTTATAVITQTHTYTAAAGAAVQMRNRVELDAWAAPVGATARTLDTDLEWVRRSSPSLGWYLAPGQRLAYMASAVTNGNANTIIGTVAKTIPLPIGQRVKIYCKPVSMYVAAAAGIVYYSIRATNAAADISPSTVSPKKTTSRGMHPGSSGVTSVPGTAMEMVTTQAQPVSAALFNEFGVTYDVDGQELWIEAA